MNTKQLGFVLLVIAALTLSACGRAATPETGPANAATAAEVIAEQATPTVDVMLDEESSAAAMMEEKLAAEAVMDEKATDAEMMMEEQSSAEAMTKEKSPADAMMEGMPTPDALMVEESPAADAMMAEETPAADAMMDAPAVDLPAWLTAQLTDVNTGQSFVIADYRGKVVLVETLAVWCSNCLKQQKQVLALHETLGERDDFVSVGIDIDLNESAEQLKAHADRNGFDWVYAVATPDVAREIGELYGVQFLNPPATPMLIVDRQGQAHPLPFGIKSAGDLQTALAPFLSEGM